MQEGVFSNSSVMATHFPNTSVHQTPPPTYPTPPTFAHPAPSPTLPTLAPSANLATLAPPVSPPTLPILAPPACQCNMKSKC